MFNLRKIIFFLDKKKNKEHFSPEKQIEEEKIGLRVHGLTLIITGLFSLTMLLSIHLYNSYFSKNKGDSGQPTSLSIQLQDNYQKKLYRLYFVLTVLSVILSFSGLVMVLHSYSDTKNQVKILVSPICYTVFIAMLYFGVKFLLNDNKKAGGVLIGLSIISLLIAMVIQGVVGDKITDIKKDNKD